MFLAENSNSRFAALNRAIVVRVFEHERFNIATNFCTAVGQCEARSFRWSGVEFPAVELSEDLTGLLARRLIWNGREITALPQLREPDYRKYLSVFGSIPCDRMLFLRGQYGLRILPLWERLPRRHGKDVPWLTMFPHGWRPICVITSELRQFWNKDHPLVRMVTTDDWRWERERSSNDVLGIAQELLSVPARAAAWTLSNMHRSERYWNGIRDQRPEFFARLLALLLQRSGGDGLAREICAVIYDRKFEGSSEVVVLSEKGMLTRDYFLRGGERRLKVGEFTTVEVPEDRKWWVEVASQSHDGAASEAASPHG